MKINEEKSLSLIASNKSIIFDAGQAVVVKFFDNLLINFGKFQTENFISKIFKKNNTKEIKGLYIQTVSSDPSNITAGDVWYNSTLGKLRGAKQVGAWASGGNMNTARQIVAGAGIQTAALVFGGNVPKTALKES